MSYPAFGKVKTLVLPMSYKIAGENVVSIEEYKRLTGIDLKDYLYFGDGDVICFDAKGACVYIQVLDDLGNTSFQYGLKRPCIPVVQTAQGSNDLISFLRIGSNNMDEGFITGIQFAINNGEEKTVDNIKISYASY